MTLDGKQLVIKLIKMKKQRGRQHVFDYSSKVEEINCLKTLKHPNIVKCVLSLLMVALYCVHCTVYSVRCTVYSVQRTVYNVQCTTYSVQRTVYNVQCTTYSVQRTVYNVQCTV